MKRKVYLWTMLAAIAASGPARASAQDPLMGVLGAIDTFITEDVVEVLESLEGREGLVDRLETIVEDPTQTRYVRVRAVTMLAFFPSTEIWDLLTRVSRSADDPEVRVQALVSLGHGFWGVDRERTERWLDRMRLFPEPKLSEAASRTLSKLRGPR